MATFKLPAARPFMIDGKRYNGVNLIYRRCIRPQDYETPKSYKKIGGFITTACSAYEEGIVTIYKTRRGYAASLYRCGCFHTYLCKCELIPA